MRPDTASERLGSLAERYWRFLCHESPIHAALAGEELDDPALFRESVDDHERRNETAGELLVELAGIAGDELGIQERATHRLLRHELESIRSLYRVHNHLRPLLFPTGPAMMTSYFANSTSIEDPFDAERYADRIATIPAYLRDLEDCLRVGVDRGIRLPALVLETAADSMRAAVAAAADSSPWYGPFVRSVAAANPGVVRQAGRSLAMIEGELFPAFGRLAAFLAGPLMEGARDSISCAETLDGRNFYRTWVREYTNSGMTPEEVHELGLAEVRRLEGEMEAVAADAGFEGRLPAYREHLSGNGFIAESAEDLRRRFQVLCKTIDGRIPSYFGRIPRMTYGIESIPEGVAERMPAAYAQPNPGDGSASGIFWVTSIPERCPTPMHVPLALHEAWPGHLMHIALVQENTALPAFRRHGAVRYPACVEGWAIYCEGLGLDMGLYQDPHQHYGRLEMEIFRALRLVVDTGIHWFGWSRDRAIGEMARSMTMARPAIEVEVDRYICWPGQALAYQIGNLEFRGLRRAAEDALGDDFSIRDFHGTLMSAGGVSLPVLRGIVNDWLQDRLTAVHRREASHANG